ncbi:hypothetical protein BDP27DRAFT_488461 [Rhodocollybia butyracea]|uniref:Nephrocystin 3-like N-terminal domain-containing protein n=1 Tax=Rhodocollybia butyracea TaxID=206335 RepID=A0A9P5Q9V5_9AGAR|nr:hypothetical protein BDP27DRAFT_488461 [Rhodocollybia butyracea]
MSFFDHSSNIVINGSNFIAVAGNQYTTSSSSSSDAQTSEVQTRGSQSSAPTQLRGQSRLSIWWNAFRATDLASGIAWMNLSRFLPGLLRFHVSSSITDTEVNSLDRTMPANQTNPDDLPSQQTEDCEELSVPTGPTGPTTVINGGTIVYPSHSKGIDRLEQAAALEALHDSMDGSPHPSCHPETRIAMLEYLQNWSLRADSGILWLNGPVGAGKSAIMRTLARNLQSAHQFGGGFFFKRSHPTRGDAKALIVTIACQLADVPWLKGPINRAVEHYPSVLKRSTEIQLEKLIFEPCRAHPNSTPLTILIDGLDECEGRERVHLRVILDAIGKSFTKHSHPLRFIIASRPEAYIRDIFELPAYCGIYQEFPVEPAHEDVQKYFLHEFARIHDEHHETMATFPRPWPTPDVLDILVERSSGHFIYASTIIKFLDDKHYHPNKRLNVDVLKDQTGTDLVFGALDQLYIAILSAVPGPRQPQLIPTLCALANFDLSPRVLDRLLELEGGETRLLLRELHSIFVVPSVKNEGLPWRGAVSAYHASFYDFLNDPKRSQKFYVGGVKDRMALVRSILKLYDCGYQDQFIGFNSPSARGLSHPSNAPLELRWRRRRVNFRTSEHSKQKTKNKKNKKKRRFPRHQLAPFITSLPPSAELLPLIHSMNPDYITQFSPESFEKLLIWMRNIDPAPEDLIQLLEDYEYMTFVAMTVKEATFRTSAKIFSCSSQRVLPQSQELRRFLRMLMLLWDSNCSTRVLPVIRLLLDVSWDNLRITICSLRETIGKDKDMFLDLCRRLRLPSFGGEMLAWASISQDLARTCICVGKDIHAGKLKDVMSWSRIQNHCNWAFQLRLCPPCDKLLRDIEGLEPMSQLPECFPEDVHHVLKWLETFADSPVEVIARWRRYLEVTQITQACSLNVDQAENGWKDFLNWLRR